jgi:MraZ protein
VVAEVVCVLFTGEYELTIDPKLRLAVPSLVRSMWDEEKHGKAWLCVPWLEGSEHHLRLYPEKVYASVTEEILRSGVFSSRDQNRVRRRLFSPVVRCELDSAGRVQLKEKHVGMLKLDGNKVAVLGVGDHLEIYSEGAWKQLAEMEEKDFVELMESVSARMRPPTP